MTTPLRSVLSTSLFAFVPVAFACTAMPGDTGMLAGTGADGSAASSVADDEDPSSESSADTTTGDDATDSSETADGSSGGASGDTSTTSGDSQDASAASHAESADSTGADESTTDTDGGDGGEAEESGESSTGDPCDSLAELPVDYFTIPDQRSSEDFAFTADGTVISAAMGSLYKSTRGGMPRTWVPGALSRRTAGTRMLPSGEVLIADVESGTLLAFDPQGGRRLILGGLEYPNGVAVASDGTIYVSEHGAGRVRRVDPDSGAFEILAEGLSHPNGLALAPGERTLYVGSFGEGTVHALDFGSDGSTSLSLFADRVGWLTEIPDDVGDAEWQACDGAREGDPCQTDNDSFGHCVRVDDSEPFCFLEWRDRPEDKVPMERFDACRGKSAGDVCETSLWLDPVHGRCVDAYDDLVMCWPDNIQGLGDLDGIAVDACGNVYVTQYLAGIVWRIDPVGDKQIVVEFGAVASWIPNMNWGPGEGGYDADKLYVISRTGDQIFELPLGIGAANP